MGQPLDQRCASDIQRLSPFHSDSTADSWDLVYERLSLKRGDYHVIAIIIKQCEKKSPAPIPSRHKYSETIQPHNTG